MSHDFLTFIFALIILILAAKSAGYLTTRIGQPAVLGELIAGLLLGPTLLDIFHLVPMFAESHTLEESITFIAELGVILLMFLAGLELELEELLNSGKVAALSGTLGVLLPLGLGMGTALLFGTTMIEAVFVGLALSATSVSISAQTLMELKVLRSKVGIALLGAAVFDDVLVILLLSVASLLAVSGGGGGAEIAITVLQMAAYLAIASFVAFRYLPRITVWINDLPINQGTVAWVLIITLFYSWSAEVLGGIAAITGAFLVGLAMARVPFREPLEHRIAALAYGFFVPVFFMNIGLLVNMRAISGDSWIFAIVLSLVAVISKIGGSGFGALVSGFNRLDSLRLGIGMVSRGEVGLIVASFALGQRLLTPPTFSIVIFMVLFATLVTPPLLRAVYSSRFSDAQQLRTLSE